MGGAGESDAVDLNHVPEMDAISGEIQITNGLPWEEMHLITEIGTFSNRIKGCCSGDRQGYHDQRSRQTKKGFEPVV